MPIQVQSTCVEGLTESVSAPPKEGRHDQEETNYPDDRHRHLHLPQWHDVSVSGGSGLVSHILTCHIIWFNIIWGWDAAFWGRTLYSDLIHGIITDCRDYFKILRNGCLRICLLVRFWDEDVSVEGAKCQEPKWYR